MDEPLFLGIEIGGTKLQLAVGRADDTPPSALERREVDTHRGADGIREQIEQVGRELIGRYRPQTVGIGFGGPVSASQGRVIKSHQVEGWDDFPLADWCRTTLGLPAVIGNDCDVAAVAEARYGAGRGARSVFYVTVGTGVGGGLVIDGHPYGGDRPAAAEIGHLRLSLGSEHPVATVESIASGRGIETAARTRFGQALSARQVVEAAAAGDGEAQEILSAAIRTLGWGIAQMITLLAPEVVVVGGGVSLAGEELFFQPLRTAVEEMGFPPLAGTTRIVPAALGELVVVYGALALAAHGPLIS